MVAIIDQPKPIIAEEGLYLPPSPDTNECRIVTQYEGRPITMVLSKIGPLYYEEGIKLPLYYKETQQTLTKTMLRETRLVIRQLTELALAVNYKAKTQLVTTGPLGVTLDYRATSGTFRQFLYNVWPNRNPDWRMLYYCSDTYNPKLWVNAVNKQVLILLRTRFTLVTLRIYPDHTFTVTPEELIPGKTFDQGAWQDGALSNPVSEALYELHWRVSQWYLNQPKHLEVGKVSHTTTAIPFEVVDLIYRLKTN